MATPTDAQITALLVLQVGDTTSGVLAANVGTLWGLHAGAATPALRQLETKLGLIDLALGEARQIVSFTDADHSQAASDLAKRLLDLRGEVLQELVAARAQAGAAGGVASGQLTTVTPQVPEPYAPREPLGPDPNAQRYSGSPFVPGAIGVRRW